MTLDPSVTSATKRHFDPLRPHRFFGVEDRYEFTHGHDSVCVYEIESLDFVTEIPVGERPDCHATSADNRYLYIACGAGKGGLWCIDQRSLTVAGVVDAGWVYATNVLPDGSTMLLHDSFGGVFIVRDIEDIRRIRIDRRIDVLGTNRWPDTLGGKGHFIDGGARYLCAGWGHNDLYAFDLDNDFALESFLLDDPLLRNGDDLVVSRDKTRAYVACYHDRTDSYVAVVDLLSRSVVQSIPTGRGTCGLTMTNDERYVVASNDADDSIAVIDTTADERVAVISAREALDEIGVPGYLQGISVGAGNEIYVYGCEGSGVVARFTHIDSGGVVEVSHRGGKTRHAPAAVS